MFEKKSLKYVLLIDWWHSYIFPNFVIYFSKISWCVFVSFFSVQFLFRWLYYCLWRVSLWIELYLEIYVYVLIDWWQSYIFPNFVTYLKKIRLIFRDVFVYLFWLSIFIKTMELFFVSLHFAAKFDLKLGLLCPPRI